ncbi:IS630 family transposase [Mesorhizobium sp. B2-4-12]|uniref:IS630 family transposase n=1 Tax=Mesorhizobium sp. B2-4-12 TaxID=2589937 RepID=UPI001129C701|nr:IS630 family transposase [Mesorhizobium sp. B2-4-12]TPK81426.1 IS630 family transposase [Mesorhizobium sp. B2-4-12]
MGKAVSQDLRLRLVRGIAEGKSRRAVAAQFEVAPSTAVRVQARYAATGSVEPARQGRPAGSGKLGPYRQAIVDKVMARPDITMPELGAWLEDEHGVRADPSNLSKLLCREGFTYKKSLLASEQERPDVRAARREWRDHHQPLMRAVPARIVFIDETSVKINMTPLRGRSLRGKRLLADAPFGKWHTQTFIAGLRCHELVAPWIIEGAIDGAAFDAYVETQLAPALGRGDIVILDNLNVHKSPRAAEALKQRGARFLFLPKYSPDLNPIEMAFAKLKTLLRKAKARTYDDLVRAVGSICAMFDPTECWNYLKQAGYVAC